MGLTPVSYYLAAELYRMQVWVNWILKCCKLRQQRLKFNALFQAQLFHFSLNRSCTATLAIELGVTVYYILAPEVE